MIDDAAEPERIFMCQFNLIITKTSAAAAFLEKLGYYLAYPLQHGYNAWCWGRQQFCNCGSVAGSCYGELREKGKYPEVLCHDDYKRISESKGDFLQQRIATLEAVQKRQLSDSFAEEEKAFRAEEKKYTDRLHELFRERFPKYKSSSSVNRVETKSIPLSREEAALKKAYDEFCQRDPILYTALQISPEYVSETLLSIKSQKSYNRDAKEFRYYRRIFSRLLKLEECVYFTHIWDRPSELKLVNTLPLNKLRVSDLALLAQNDVIRIQRKEE